MRRSRCFNLLFCALLFASFPAEVRASERPYDLQISRPEARDTLRAIARDLRLRAALGDKTDPIEPEGIERLIRSYRSDNLSSDLTIRSAPYPRFLLASLDKDTYGSMIAAQRESMRQDFITDKKPIVIVDTFLKEIVSGALTGDDDLSKAGRRIGSCLAERALIDEHHASCVLDPDLTHLDHPGLITLLLTKIDCHLPLHFVRSCTVRRRIFDAAKNSLAQMLKDPKAKAKYEKSIEDLLNSPEFPAKFRVGFLETANSMNAAMPELVSRKFGARSPERGLDDLWGDRVPLIDLDDPANPLVSLKSFSEGLSADVLAAESALRFSGAAQRGMAAALFYAAANRLFVLMGIDEATWNERARRFVLAPQQPKPESSEPPVFSLTKMGGIGVVQDPKTEKFSFQYWDLKNYSPRLDKDPSPLQLFPTHFVLKGRAVPELPEGEGPVENLEDFSAMAQAFLDFTEASAPGQPLAPYFAADKSQFAGILDPNKTVLLPKEGRLVALGHIGNMVENLLILKRGHVEQAPNGVEFKFFERITHKGREQQVSSSIQTVAKAVFAFSEFRKLINTDELVRSLIKPDVLKMLPDALLIASNELMSGAAPDGGFYHTLGVPIKTDRELVDTVAGMEALTSAYNLTETPYYGIALKQSWVFLDHLWGDHEFPPAVEAPAAEKVQPSVLWRLLGIWDDSQGVVRKNFTDLDWARWEKRFEHLREKLREQLDSVTGPAPL